MRRRATSRVLAFALASLIAAVPAAAQDAPPADDPVPALQAAAESATGDARAAAFEALAKACEARGLWTDAAAAWRAVSAVRKSARAAAGEGRALLAFAEEILGAGEPGSAIRAAFEDARAAFERAVTLGAEDVAVRIGLARCLAADGRADDQIAALRRAIADFPGDPAPPRALGFALYNAARYADAIPVLRGLSDAAPADLSLSLTLADCARREKDEALALAMADRTIEHHANDSRGWAAVWAVYAADKRFGELTDRLAARAAAQPRNAIAAHYTGFAARDAKRWDDALDWLDRTWTLDPRNAPAHLEAARILLQQKHDRDGAARFVREVLVGDPKNQAAANLLSFIVLRRSDDGDHAGAAADLEFLAVARPDDAIVHANLGLEARWAGRYAFAERAYTRAVELSPRDSQLRNDFGLLYLIVGRDDDARAQFLAAHEVDPEANDGVENLSWMARRDGRLDEALTYSRIAYRSAVRRGSYAERHRRNMDDARFPLPPLGAAR